MPDRPIVTKRVEEPVLPMTEIQGIAIPGFLKPHQTLLGLQIDEKPGSIQSFKAFLREFAGEVSTAADTLADRRSFRSAQVTKDRKPAARRPLVAIGFTYQGLLKLTPGATDLASVAFRKGLAARSALLGDPSDPRNEGHPDNWKVGGTGQELDALIVIAGDDRGPVNKRAAEIVSVARRAKIRIRYRENGDVRDDLPGHEHFGFSDGISQPGVRGRASEDPADFITRRRVAERDHPNHSLFGSPGQDLVWPGVLVLGHPATSPDPLIPGLPSAASPEWAQNGSFLVFRRLRQDVGLFWRTMRTEAQRLSKLPGFEGMTDLALAARLVGRWPSGAPVNRVPDGDDQDLGRDSLANNHFRFDSDASALELNSGYQDKFPQSKADPAGITCPWAAHIRKVNTRDSGSDTGGRDSTYSRRILRIGVTFGKPLQNRYAEKKDDPQKGNRGVLFLSIQASIDEQFEFLAARWMNDPSRPKMPGGHDMLVGQNNAHGEDRQRRCVIFGSRIQQAHVSTNAQWIVPTGGGYFFIPSLGALREALAG
jgi:Dyp-type peroxidase family